MLLHGVVGSTAYGLNTPESDVDTAGVFRAPTEMFLGLTPPTDHNSSIQTHAPDAQMHEAGKFLRLVLKANPTVTELLWLDRTGYLTLTDDGEALLGLRKSVLGSKPVHDAYFGYAKAQFHKIENRSGDEQPKRIKKHARHLLRLLDQGIQLYRTGELTVRVDDPQRYFDFGEAVAAGDLSLAATALAHAGDVFHIETSPLPEFPDPSIADAVLRRIRKKAA